MDDASRRELAGQGMSKGRLAGVAWARDAHHNTVAHHGRPQKKTRLWWPFYFRRFPFVLSFFAALAQARQEERLGVLQHLLQLVLPVVSTCFNLADFSRQAGIVRARLIRRELKHGRKPEAAGTYPKFLEFLLELILPRSTILKLGALLACKEESSKRELKRNSRQTETSIETNNGPFRVVAVLMRGNT
jgi:hypothetical protein